MDKSDILQKIGLFDYPNCEYLDVKKLHYQSFNRYLSEGCSIIESVNGHYYHGFDKAMDENGMEKFVAMLSGMLFMIEHDEVEADQAYGTYYDVKNFETGEYDNLFTPEDLKLIKADIKIIQDYLADHPELLEN